ncbi:MAG: aminotransferase class V-fold PLP-dependent enzyme, partial [Candidatus Aenigmarchaeota archaeon]|nr:aminotransferase class V-fold PLP-dependent enzyme [Candidatus Aenigmarchaeota archaeon]
MNTDKIREDFPILQRRINGKPLIYLDSTATTQKPRQVIEAEKQFYELHNANIHRGVHTLSEEATELHESARAKIARFIGAQPEEIVFTRNATEAINLVRYAWGHTNIRKGDKILATEMEHHSNLVPWQLLAKEREAKLDFIGIDNNGFLIDKDIDSKIPGSRLVAFTHMSNVLGTINNAEEIIQHAHAAGALTLVDAAQSVPHMGVDVRELDADFLVFSGHKMLGPTGIGVLYGKRELMEAMPPFLGGGDMIKEVHLRDATWNDLPWKFEAGT